jgi:hypothetical protein
MAETILHLVDMHIWGVFTERFIVDSAWFFSFWIPTWTLTLNLEG